MPLNSLLLDSLWYKNELKENKTSIQINRSTLSQSSETFLLFKSDNDQSHFKKTWLRKYQTGYTGNPNCCDAIAYYHDNTNSEKPVTICFIELKGKDLPTAVEQIKMTYEAVSAQLKEDKIPLSKIHWKAVIVTSYSLPRDKNTVIKPLIDKFSYDNVKLEHTNKYDILPFIKN